MSNKTDVSKWIYDITTDVRLMSKEEQRTYLQDMLDIDMPLNDIEWQTWKEINSY